MKKLLNFIILPIIAIMMFVGCGCDKDRTVEDVQNAYNSMINSYIEDEENKFFSDENNPHAIKITYTSSIAALVNDDTPSNEVERRYRALFYQQKVLDEIFNYYNTYQEKFYSVIKNAEVDEDRLNDLYDSVVNLHNTLDEFKDQYSTLIAATRNGLPNVMQFNLTSYSFHLNNLIDASFNFIFKFRSMYLDYCVEDYTLFDKANLDSYVDVAYLDSAYMIYLENIKSFNISVGDNGVCDLGFIVGSEDDFNLLNNLLERKTISLNITSDIGMDTEMGRNADLKVRAFTYARDVYNQRLSSYLSTYNSLDMYAINQYKYGLNGVDYNSYLILLSSSERSIIEGMETFVSECFIHYLDKLNEIVQ